MRWRAEEVRNMANELMGYRVVDADRNRVIAEGIETRDEARMIANAPVLREILRQSRVGMVN